GGGGGDQADWEGSVVSSEKGVSSYDKKGTRRRPPLRSSVSSPLTSSAPISDRPERNPEVVPERSALLQGQGGFGSSYGAGDVVAAGA
ncbi:unnamed protein product, partial [Discosporangium mesarthrocarpum]